MSGEKRVLDPLQPTPATIAHYRQNKPMQIARDFKKLFGIPTPATFAVLLSRGVFKWFAVRRDLIKAKLRWRDKVRDTIEAIREAKKTSSLQKLYFLRGYLKALEECRAEVREMCHSERWRAPDFDHHAWRFLRRFEVGR